MHEESTKVISSTTFQRNIGRVQSDVAMGKEHVVIAAHGRPMMVLIPAEDYEELQRDRRDALRARLGLVRSAAAVQ
jgi:prevent-host-death family protein